MNLTPSFRDQALAPRKSAVPVRTVPQAGAASHCAVSQDPAVTVLIYLDTSKQVGDPDHLKVFTNADAAEKWFEENDPEGVAFEYKVIQPSA